MNPLFEFKNGTIEIATGFTPGTYLDRFGNVCPNVQNAIVDVYLKTEALSTATKTEKQPGVDQSAQLLTGYCVNPSILPMDTKTATWYKCRFGKSEGWLFLNPFDRFGREGIDTIIEAEIGTKINGWFQIGRVT